MSGTSIIEVAALAGVSPQTVARVAHHSPLIDGPTRTRVERVIAETGFVYAGEDRLRVKQRNPLIVLAHDDPADLALLDIQSGMFDALNRSEFLLCVHRFEAAGRGLLREFSDFLEFRRPSGIVLHSSLASILELGGLCWEFGCGFAAIGGGDPASAFLTSDRIATARLVDYLVSIGHRRIGYIAGPEHDRAAQQRELGYLDAMAVHGLDRGPALIAGGDGSFASGEVASALLLEVSPSPTAIIAACDEMAAGTIETARTKRIAVPDELSVLGFGGGPLAERIVPPLTTARVPLREMASAATLAMIAPDANLAKRGEWQAEVVVRQSTGPAPDHAGAGSPVPAFQSG